MNFALLGVMKNLSHIWPTAAEMARDLGIPYATVNSWLYRGEIPPRRWAQVVRAAKARGFDLTLDQLAGISPDLGAA